jgi:glutamate dehydrogenase (NAD(P)+)/glutamate dehydrogenase (NADP+)
MATDVSTHEVFRLARAMTLKNSAAGIPYGGAKSAILSNPGCGETRTN